MNEEIYFNKYVTRNIFGEMFEHIDEKIFEEFKKYKKEEKTCGKRCRNNNGISKKNIIYVNLRKRDNFRKMKGVGSRRKIQRTPGTVAKKLRPWSYLVKLRQIESVLESMLL